MIEIADSALLSDLFGHWPDFHDAARMFLGARLTALSAPLPFGAYPFLAITLLGWAWAHLSTRPARNAAP